MDYRIVLESHLGPRFGTLSLDADENGQLTGTLTLLGCENTISGIRLSDSEFHIIHKLHTLTRDIDCASDIFINGGRLTGRILLDNEVMEFYGEKLLINGGANNI